jgi:chemotaxis protein CheD
MNHFMLPAKKQNQGSWGSNESYICRYGNWAMEYLINEVIKHGGSRNNMKAKVFGGEKIINSLTSDIGVGNVEFVLQYVKLEDIPIIGNDTGGP